MIVWWVRPRGGWPQPGQWYGRVRGAVTETLTLAAEAVVAGDTVWSGSRAVTLGGEVLMTPFDGALLTDQASLTAGAGLTPTGAPRIPLGVTLGATAVGPTPSTVLTALGQAAMAAGALLGGQYPIWTRAELWTAVPLVEIVLVALPVTTPEPAGPPSPGITIEVP